VMRLVGSYSPAVPTPRLAKCVALSAGTDVVCIPHR
jgi:hypothetical protein